MTPTTQCCRRFPFCGGPRRSILIARRSWKELILIGKGVLPSLVKVAQDDNIMFQRSVEGTIKRIKRGGK